MRRLLFALVLLILAAPTTASASSWHQFSSKKLGFSVQYPPTWHLVKGTQGGVPQVTLTYQHGQLFLVSISVLPIKGSSSRTQTLSRFIRYEKGTGNLTLTSIQWKAVKLGGKQASSGVVRPQTEGGVGLAQGIYVASSGARVYEITLVAYGKHPPVNITRFPSIYRQILGTWRFV
jgi:hypothetical protein